jgi:hypothetical protein
VFVSQTSKRLHGLAALVGARHALRNPDSRICGLKKKLLFTSSAKKPKNDYIGTTWYDCGFDFGKTDKKH